jgi:rhodanese-related sulfurtransferase
MPGILQLLDEFRQTSKVLMDFVISRSPSERAAPSNPEAWSARDVITLIGFWMTFTTDRMAYFVRGTSAPRDVDFDALNRQALVGVDARAWDKVVVGTMQAFTWLVKAVGDVDDAVLLLPNGYGDGPDEPLWREVRDHGCIWPLQQMETYCRRHGDDARADAIHATLVAVTGEPEVIVCDLIAPQAVGQLRIPPVIIDVRDAATFAAGHLPDARHIPLAHLADHLDELPQDRAILTYCDMHHPGRSRGEHAAAALAARGYAARALDGGYPAWQHAGLPIATGQE